MKRLQKASMPATSHYFYFLATENEPLEQAWRTLVGHFGLRECELCQFGHGPLLGRLAEGESCALTISILEHIAILELRLEGGGVQDQNQRVRIAREKLGDLLYELVGESSFVAQVGEADSSFGSHEFLPIELPDGARLLVAYPADPSVPRQYLLFLREPEQAARLMLPLLVPLDCLTCQIERQLAFHEDQLHSLMAQEQALSRSIGAILNRKAAETEQADLEREVEKTAEIYGLMSSYHHLLSSAQGTLRGDLSRLEELAGQALPRQDAYFYGFHRVRLKRFLARLAASRQVFSRSLDNAKAAIDIMKSRVDLANSRTNLGLQKQLGMLMRQNITIQEEGLLMASAATMVEFFVVLYYGFGVWKTLAGEELMRHIPVLLKAGLMGGFSLTVVVGTHLAAKAIKQKGWQGVLAAGLAICLAVAAMVWVSLLYGS